MPIKHFPARDGAAPSAPKNEAELKPARELNRSGRLLTPTEAGNFLRISNSWLAKARIRGDGPPYLKIGRSIRYGEDALAQWMRSHLHRSTSEPL